MRLFLTSIASRPAATAFVLAALLAVLSLQVAELGHQHHVGDLAEHCLTCKGESAKTVAVANASAEARLPIAQGGSQTAAPVPAGIVSVHRARAPPRLS